MSDRPLTIVHVTHEAVEHLGGIGTVLAGLVTSPVYKRAVRRSLFIGPLWDYAHYADPARRLGAEGVEVRYSGPEGYDPLGCGGRLKPIEWAFNTKVVYGVRRVEMHNGADRDAEVETLLFDVRGHNSARTDSFKRLLREKFGIDAGRYEHDDDFVQWLRLASPAVAAMHALLDPADYPAVVISHEYMGMPTALLASLDGPGRFRTVFHAHECSTARRVVESHPGHDCAFYPAMRRAEKAHKKVEEVFGDQSSYARHPLVAQCHRLDLTLAVGDETAEELKFLSRDAEKANITVCYNGVPAERVDMDAKRRSRAMIDAWLKNVLGFAPDYLFTHVTRPVVSKGLWRDLKLCAHLERRLKEKGKRAVYLLLTCGAAIRTREQADAMAARYGWPREHHESYPDLQGPEAGIWHMMQVYNNPGRPGSGAVTALLVNQFGFSRERLGSAAPEGVSISDLRRATDVELGLSIYEPFGIAPLEPLHAGAVAVVSSVSGCCGFLRRAIAESGQSEQDCRNLLIADFTSIPVERPLEMSREDRDRIEEAVVEQIAPALMSRLPANENDRMALLERGQRLASDMGWDRVCEREFLPALRGITR